MRCWQDAWFAWLQGELDLGVLNGYKVNIGI